MNTLRLFAITLPMTLLLACGGGGSSSTATPSTGGGNTPQALPTALITDPVAARRGVRGSTPPTATATQAQQTFQMRAMDADTLVESDVYLTTGGTGGADVSTPSITIDGNTFTFSLNSIRQTFGDRFELTGISSQYEPVMVHNGVTLAQYQAAGRNDDSDVFEYLSYGGWLANSAFSVDMLTINDDSNESSALVGISYGDASGSRPTGTVDAQYDGLVVGVQKSSGDVIQGILSILIPASSLQTSGGSPYITLIEFQDFVNFNGALRPGTMSWTGVPIATDGTFSSTTGGDIDGAFFGDGHTEVGGTFNRNGFIGAFGGAR